MKEDTEQVGVPVGVLPPALGPQPAWGQCWVAEGAIIPGATHYTCTTGTRKDPCPEGGIRTNPGSHAPSSRTGLLELAEDIAKPVCPAQAAEGAAEVCWASGSPDGDNNLVDNAWAPWGRRRGARLQQVRAGHAWAAPA